MPVLHAPQSTGTSATSVDIRTLRKSRITVSFSTTPEVVEYIPTPWVERFEAAPSEDSDDSGSDRSDDSGPDEDEWVSDQDD